MFVFDLTNDRETLAFFTQRSGRIQSQYPVTLVLGLVYFGEVCLTHQRILVGFLLSVRMVWCIFSESELGRHRSLRASLMSEGWIRGRDGPLMEFCP